MRVACALVASILVAALVGACGGQPANETAATSLRRALSEGTRLLLPSTEPPGLVDATATLADGIRIISFYSLNEPIVSVCVAPAERCLELMPTADLIPRDKLDSNVTVLIEAQEPGVAMTLSPELVRYWSEVDLVEGTPAWLDAP